MADLAFHELGHRLDGLRIPGSEPHNLQTVADWGERVAQLVSQHRQELALAAVGVPQFDSGLSPLDYVLTAEMCPVSSRVASFTVSGLS